MKALIEDSDSSLKALERISSYGRWLCILQPVKAHLTDAPPSHITFPGFTSVDRGQTARASWAVNTTGSSTDLRNLTTLANPILRWCRWIRSGLKVRYSERRAS